MPTVASILGNRKVDTAGSQWEAHFKTYGKKYNEPQRELVDKTTLVGIEVEVENVRTPGVTHLWQIHSDGSLRNNGIEFVSYPMKGDNVGIALNQLYDSILPKDKVFSTRTSIHVHMDVNTLEVDQLYRLFILYLVVEPILYEWIGQHRKDNIFCVPWFKTTVAGNYASALKDFANIWKTKGFVQHNSHRYSGLNLESLGKYGTFEFRHLAGTDSVDRIITWINILLTLRNAANSAKTDDLIERICALNTKSDYRMFCQDVFGPLFREFQYFNIETLLNVGCLNVKHSTIVNTFEKELTFSPDSPLARTLKKMGLKTNKPAQIYEEILADMEFRQAQDALQQRINVNEQRQRLAGIRVDAAPAAQVVRETVPLNWDEAVRIPPPQPGQWRAR